MAVWLEKAMDFIKKNAECVFTLAGVLLYMALRGVAGVLGLGIVVKLLGAALTVVGVLATRQSGKSAEEKRVAYITHAAIWVLKGVLAWIAGICLVVYVVNYMINGRSGQTGQGGEN